jgi:hypothetical protein
MTTQTERTNGQTQTREPQSEMERLLSQQRRETTSIKEAASMLFLCHPDKVFDLCRNFWPQTQGQKSLSDGECRTGLILCVKYGLDPAAKEIYVMRDKHGKISVIIGIDGWIKIVHRCDDYNGHETTEGWSEDGKNLEWVETKIYSKKRDRPTCYKGYAQEYAKLGGFMLGKIPWHMLKLYSFRHAARFFAPIGGSVVTEEEAKWISAYDKVDTSKATIEKLLTPTATDDVPVMMADAVDRDEATHGQETNESMSQDEIEAASQTEQQASEPEKPAEPDPFSAKKWADDFVADVPNVTKQKDRREALATLKTMRAKLGEIHHAACVIAAKNAGWTMTE